MIRLFDQYGGLLDPQLRLDTKRGNQIPNESPYEKSPEILIHGHLIVKKKHPNVRLRALSNVYNCGGMVFGARRTHILPADFDMILEDDDYQTYSIQENPMIGDLVIYRYNDSNEIAHVGVVSHVGIGDHRTLPPVYVLSKWGFYGEYIHRIDDVTADMGLPTEYCADRGRVAARDQGH